MKGLVKMKEVVIVSAVRTAIGAYNGGLAEVSAVELGALVIKEAIKRAKIDPVQVAEVIMGNVLQAGLGQNPARQASLKAGLPVEIPALTINKVCGSGLEAVNLAARTILAGDADIVVAGGMESMSNAPYLLEKARRGYRMGHGELIDSMIKDGLWCATNDYHMGITAENVAQKYDITRQMQDELAASSQEKALKAIQEERFKEEIVPVIIPQKKGNPIVFATDEHLKVGTTIEKLATLRTAFKKDGSVTAGNASGLNDGAAALVVMSFDKAKKLGLTPLARFVSSASAGVDPSIMGIGPVPATQKALTKAGLTVADLDLIEANEAFAAQFLAVGKELNFDKDKVNVHGGAIALGHPVGASGARILVTLLHAMKQRDAKVGLATLCIGGGQGVATIVEKI